MEGTAHTLGTCSSSLDRRGWSIFEAIENTQNPTLPRGLLRLDRLKYLQRLLTMPPTHLISANREADRQIEQSVACKRGFFFFFSTYPELFHLVLSLALSQEHLSAKRQNQNPQSHLANKKATILRSGNSTLVHPLV